MRDFFNYDKIAFDYKPFPMALAQPIREEGLHREFVDNFPSLEIMASFEAMGKARRKYTLSERRTLRVLRSADAPR